MDSLSHDVYNANPGLDTIFDKEKEQQRLREAQAISDIGVQVADIARTQGAIDATKAAQEKMQNISPAERDAAITDWQKKNPGKTPSEKEINDQVYQNAYDKAFAASGMGTGGKVQQAIQAATAAIQGLAGGDLANAAAGGAAPYLATVIKNVVGEENKAANLMAHAAVNAALALARGENVAAGAATGEAMGMIALEVYGKDASALSEQEKQTVSALATLASGLAGGLAGDSTSSVVSGALAGKTTVENNNLSAVARLGVTACAEVATCRNMVVEKGLGALLGIGAAKTALDNLSSSERDYVFSVAMSGKADLIERLTPEQRAAYNYMVGQDQKGLITVFPKPDRELTDSKLINPGHSDQQGLVNTGNNQPLESGPTHTGNSDGLVNTGGTSTVTPLPDGPSKDDLAYMAEESKYVPSPKHAPGGWGTPMDLSDAKAQKVLNNSIQGGKQRYWVTDGKLYEFQPDNVGGWHGYPILGTEAPPKVLREFLTRGDISKAEYNKLIKGK